MHRYAAFLSRSQPESSDAISESAYEMKISVLDSILNSEARSEILIGDETYSVGLIDKKDSGEESIKTIYSDLSNDLEVGTVFSYNDESWLIYSQKYDVVNAYFEGDAIRCNQKIKYINDYGELQEFYAFTKGSMESFDNVTFKGSPLTESETSKLYGICSYNSGVTKEDRFKIKDKVWKIINIDDFSIEGVFFLSCLEDETYNIDDEIAQSEYYSWEIKQDDVHIQIEDWYEINPTFLKSNEEVEHDFTIATEDDIQINGNFIRALVPGNYSLTIKLDNTNISKDINVTALLATDSYTEYYIRPDRASILSGMNYIFYGEKEVDGQIIEGNGQISIIDGEEFLESYEIDGNSLALVVDKNVPSSSVITLSYLEDGQTTVKEIIIKRLL